MRNKRSRNTSARQDLVILLLLDSMLVADLCYELFWAPPTYPPARPWLSGTLAILCCWDTARRTLRFRELTGHWPDPRKPDLGANDLKKEEK